MEGRRLAAPKMRALEMARIFALQGAHPPRNKRSFAFCLGDAEALGPQLFSDWTSNTPGSWASGPATANS